MHRFSKRLCFSLAFLLIFTTGCTTAATSQTTDVSETVDSAEQTSDTESESVELVGSFNDTESLSDVNETIQSLILQYMNLYYQGLADLNYVSFESLYDNEDGYLLDKAFVDYEIYVRDYQSVDYTLTAYDFSLDVEFATEVEDGLMIAIREDSVENFTGLEGIDSKRYDRFHLFYIDQVDGTYYINYHINFMPVANMLLSDYWSSDEESDEESTATFSLSFDTQAIIDELDSLKQELVDNYPDISEQELTQSLNADYDYDRQAALDYAVQYIDTRNDEWYDYSGVGGNCQNYASQVLYAGGIPFDLTGTYIWKWYSDVPSTTNNAAGRSPSWTGVDEFMEYAANTSGAGLVAQCDEAYYAGEVADLIHIGVEGSWRHTVVISQLVLDDDGNTVDYLVYSNTSNLQDYPISLYGYTTYQLTHIVGYN